MNHLNGDSKTPEEQAKNRRNGVSPVNGIAPPADHRFKPGQSGNPGGRPKGRSITAELRDMLDSEKDGGSLAKAMAAKAFEFAQKGDFRFWNAILERLDGKLIEKMEGDHTIRVEYVRAERIVR